MNTQSSTHALRAGRRAVRLALALAVPLLSTPWLAAPAAQAVPDDRPAPDQAGTPAAQLAEPPAEQARVPADPPAGPPAAAPADPPAADPPAAPPADPPAAPPVEPPAAVPAESPAAPPADPPAAAPADPPAAAAAPEAAPAKKSSAAKTAQPRVTAQVEAPGDRVVVCKYVRKPGEAELLHHVVIVNEEALLGRGFTGSFPFEFSDAHIRSVALRYAADGEQARDVPLSGCPAPETPPPPPPEEEPEPPVLPPAGVIDGPEGPEGRDVIAPPPAADVGDRPDAGALPATGAPEALAGLMMAGLTLLLLGCSLVLRGLRRQSAAMSRSSAW